MSETEFCLLTAKDFTILEVMLERRLGRDDPLVPLMRRKLSGAVVMFRDNMPPNVVTLNSRVIFRVDEHPAETRILAADELRGLVGMILPLTNRRGLALLGLAEGQAMTLEKEDGRTETIRVIQLLYQPEAASREPGPLGARSRTGPFLRVVHRPDDLQAEPPRRMLADAATDFDDPGPSAA